MSLFKITGIFLGSAAVVAGHGYISGAVINGQYYAGYDVNTAPYTSDPPDTIGWSTTATDTGFVSGTEYSNPDIICHRNAEPGTISAEITAGGEIELQWTTWPEDHRGPVLTYLAKCNGDCSSVDKSTLEFFKIDEKGLVDGSQAPGTWATDQLVSANNTWTVTIPSSIAAGNYVLRHEIIALHSAQGKDGAQNYPQCVNLKVTGGGSDQPFGTLGTALYSDNDPGILIDIYQSLSSYDIPGPALYSGLTSGSVSSITVPSTTSSATTSATPSSTRSTASSRFTTSPSSTSAPNLSAVQPPITTPTEVPPAFDRVAATVAYPQWTKGEEVPSASVPVATPSASANVPSYTGISRFPNRFTEFPSAHRFWGQFRNSPSWLITDKRHPRDISV